MPHAADPLARTRSFLLWAVAISIALHLLLAPLVLRLKSAAPPEEIARQPLQLFTPAPRAIPTPPPPTPTPTPHPASTPKRVAVLPSPRAARPVAVPRPRALRPQRNAALPSHALARSVAQAGTGATPGGLTPEAGAGGTGTGGSAPTAAAVTPVPATPSPTPAVSSPTPKPACAQPNVDARMVSRVDAEYPEIPRSQGITGTATIEVTLGASGAVRSASVFHSSGNAALDDAAIRSARESRYAAEISNCESVGGTYLFVAEFETQ